jgi:HemY protein
LGREAGRVSEPEDPWLSELHAWCFNPHRLRILATIQYQTRQGDRGLELMERSVALAPEESEGHILLGDLCLKLGDFARARDSLRQGLDRATATPSPLVYVNLATAYRSLGEPEKALAVAQEGLAQQPHAFEIHDAIGVALGELGRMDDAMAAFNQALALSPNDVNTNFNLALALLGFGRIAEARVHLERSLTSQPTFAKSLVLLAQLDLEAGRLESARTYAEPLYNAYPEMPRARQLMGIWHRKTGEIAEKGKDLAAAEKHFRAGLEIDPEDPELNATLGVFLLVQNRVPEALPLLEKYHQLKPLAAQASFFLGQAFARLGRTEDARRVLTEGEKLALESNNTTTAELCREILRSL